MTELDWKEKHFESCISLAEITVDSLFYVAQLKAASTLLNEVQNHSDPRKPIIKQGIS